MPAWPGSLPQSPESQGYGEEIPFPIVQAPVDGPPLSRRRYTAAPRPTKASFLVTLNQLETFETFYQTDIKHGALSFTWNIRGDVTKPANFRIVGSPAVSHRAGLYWFLSLDLIRLP